MPEKIIKYPSNSSAFLSLKTTRDFSPSIKVVIGSKKDMARPTRAASPISFSRWSCSFLDKPKKTPIIRKTSKNSLNAKINTATIHIVYHTKRYGIFTKAFNHMFIQRLIEQIRAKKTPLCVGLDPRLEWLPKKITHIYKKKYGTTFKAASYAIVEFNQHIIDVIASLVPAVKLQIAFYEQYGPFGMQAFLDSTTYAKKKGLVVIVDAKRGDIDSTVKAYVNAFLGKTDIFGTYKPCYDVDCITVNPFLGEESMLPFIEACKKYGKGIFILVKTSNAGSTDIQDQKVGRVSISEKIAQMVDRYAREMIVTKYGYSNIGAVIGLQFPLIAQKMRKIMPYSFFLIPGYGAQGGDIKNAKYFFNQDGLGALINSSRKVVFSYYQQEESEKNYLTIVKRAVLKAKEEIRQYV